MLHIAQARFQNGHRLLITFSDGREGLVDFQHLIGKELPQVFSALRDEALFRQFKIQEGTLTWPGDLDLAPEYLYFCAFQADSTLQDQFRAWGYIHKDSFAETA